MTAHVLHETKRCRLPDGSIADVRTDVLELGRRIAKGDPTYGWRGDENLALCFNAIDQEWIVVGTNLRGDEYVAARGGTHVSLGEAGPRILRSLVEGDWQDRGGAQLAERVQKAQEQRHDSTMRSIRHRAEAVQADVYDMMRHELVMPRSRFVIDSRGHGDLVDRINSRTRIL